MFWDNVWCIPNLIPIELGMGRIIIYIVGKCELLYIITTTRL